MRGPVAPSPPATGAPVRGGHGVDGWVRGLVSTRLVGVATGLALAVGGWWAWTSWMSRSEAPVVAAAPEPLPVVRRADVLIDTAQTLYVSGHLHDALRALDRAGAAPIRGEEVTRLRARIQHDLLTAASGTPAAVGEAGVER